MIRGIIKLAGLGAGGVLLASCATYPYDTAFTSCEAEANSCYRLCEDIPDENGYIACQRHCDADIDRCFNSAYNSYGSTYYGYGYGSPWYGRYGAWYPDYGYYLSFNFYDRYGYRKNRGYPWGPGRYTHSPRDNHGGRHDGDRNRYDNHNSGNRDPRRSGGYPNNNTYNNQNNTTYRNRNGGQPQSSPNNNGFGYPNGRPPRRNGGTPNNYQSPPQSGGQHPAPYTAPRPQFQPQPQPRSYSPPPQNYAPPPPSNSQPQQSGPASSERPANNRGSGDTQRGSREQGPRRNKD